MAIAQLIEIAEAVKELVNAPGAPGLSQAFTAERAFMPVAQRQASAELKVWVVPKSVETSPVSRTGNQVRYAVDVAVQQAARTLAECDGLMALVEEIADYLDRRSLPGVAGAHWVGTANAPIWDPADMQERHLFTTVITVTYRMSRPAPA